MIQFKENGQTDGRTDRQALFYRTVPATAGGPTSNIAINKYKYTRI